MAGVSFSQDRDQIWIVAGWVFRQFLSDLRAHIHDDRLTTEMLDADVHGFLQVDLMSASIGTTMTEAIRLVVSGMLDGSVPSGVGERFPDAATKDQYFEALRALRKNIPDRMPTIH